MALRSLGVIGCGNMGTALVTGIVESGVLQPENIYIMDIDTKKVESLRSTLKVKVKDTIKELVEDVEAVLVAVKPQDMKGVLEEMAKYMKEEQIIISIAAGISTEFIYNAIGRKDIQIVRVMPNTPALVKEGAFGIYFRNIRSEEAKRNIEAIFKPLGVVVEVKKEELMDVVTGLSGSGPAYIFLVINALADGAVRMGLDRKTAQILAIQTVLGSAKLAMEKLKEGIHPEALKDMIMSPAGTTAEGIFELEKFAVRSAFISAVEKATKRSRELGG